MLFTETGNPNNNVDGGYVRAAIRNMDSANKTKYMALLNSLHKLNDKSNGGKAGKTMSGGLPVLFRRSHPYSGNNKVKTDYTGNVAGTAASNAIYALPRQCPQLRSPGRPTTARWWTEAARATTSSTSAMARCRTTVRTRRTATTQLQTAATAEGITGATTAIPINPAGSQDNVADEWARFMKKSSKAITTYTVDVDKVTTGQGPGWTALLKSMAGVSGGKYFDVSSGNGGAQVADALGRIFSEIQAVNSVFASVSLPVSVNTRGHLPQPGLRRHVPARPGRVPALGRQPQAVQAGADEQRHAAANAWMPTARRDQPGDRLHHRVCAQLLDADDGRQLLDVPAAGRVHDRWRELRQLELTRTAGSSRRARRPTCCAARPRAR